MRAGPKFYERHRLKDAPDVFEGSPVGGLKTLPLAGPKQAQAAPFGEGKELPAVSTDREVAGLRELAIHPVGLITRRAGERAQEGRVNRMIFRLAS